jgi:hypothetical protein
MISASNPEAHVTTEKSSCPASVARTSSRMEGSSSTYRIRLRGFAKTILGLQGAASAAMNGFIGAPPGGLEPA